MEASEKIEQLIETKSWSELTVDEKAFVVDALGSEEQYNAMRDVHFSLLENRKLLIQPDRRIIGNLQKRIREKHSVSHSGNLSTYKVPAFMALGLIVVSAFAGWIAARYSIKPETVSQVIQVRDTLYIASKPDTIFVDKVRYKTIIKEIPVNVSLVDAETAPQASGINMKEAEALETLLVSGSE